MIQYRDGGNSDYGTLVFGTVDGSSITFTSPTVFNTANTGANSSVFDSNANKVVIAYQDAGNSCLLYTSPSPRDRQKSRMPSSA